MAQENVELVRRGIAWACAGEPGAEILSRELTPIEERQMDDRWIPILAGVIGVIGGVGGAVVGGVIANEGQEDQFEKDRAAELQDVREQTYVKFVGAAENVFTVGGEENEAVANAALAEVALLSPTLAQPARGVFEAARNLRGTESAKQQQTERVAYSRQLNRFIVLAQDEIGLEE
jgi:hypothetical protein